MLNAGDLDQRIVIERAETLDTGLSKRAGPFAPILTLWAKREDVGGSERVKAGENAAEVVARFVVRRTPVSEGVLATDRVVHRDQVLAIQSTRRLGPDGIEINASARTDVPA